MLHDMIFIVTGADHILGIQPIIKRERYIEYMMSLHKIFSYHIPTYGVLSEIRQDDDTDRPPFEKFPFLFLKKINEGELGNVNKSTKEFMCISMLLRDLPIIDNDTFIIKISGRYLIINDSFMKTVKENEHHTEIAAIIRTSDHNTQQYTFLYAMRFRYIKQFFEKSVQLFDSGVSIEYALFSFLKEQNLMKNTITVDELGILTHINNDKIFAIY